VKISKLGQRQNVLLRQSIPVLQQRPLHLAISTKFHEACVPQFPRAAEYKRDNRHEPSPGALGRCDANDLVFVPSSDYGHSNDQRLTGTCCKAVASCREAPEDKSGGRGTPCYSEKNECIVSRGNLVAVQGMWLARLRVGVWLRTVIVILRFSSVVAELRL
jgi:hypothetical protein